MSISFNVRSFPLRKYASNLAVIASLFGFFTVVSRHLPAGYVPASGYATLELSGDDFGKIAEDETVQTLVGQLRSGKHSLKIERNFMTDASLSAWAKSSVHAELSADEAVIRRYTADGQLLETYVLSRAKPTKWSVQSDSSNRAGYRESIELLYAKIELL